MIYDVIAPVYDAINEEIDYRKWADFIQEAEKRFGKVPVELVLDLACGTGKMTLELARRGYDMTGVDLSPEMLDRAREAAVREGLDGKMLWLLQDMTAFELYGTVDLTVCCLDSINHLINKKELDKCLALVHNYLVPEGLFIFDCNGEGKFLTDYADETYAYETENGFCVWQNAYDEKSRLCDFYITLFTKKGNLYERFDDMQTERCYTIRQMKNSLEKNGFEYIGAFSDFDFCEASDTDKRIYFVARCRK